MSKRLILWALLLLACSVVGATHVQADEWTAPDALHGTFSVGTPVLITGSANSDVTFESRDGRPGSGIEFGGTVRWLGWQHGPWAFGPLAGFDYQYLRTATSADGGYTQGSATVYAPLVGAVIQYDLGEVLGAPWNVAVVLGVGPACVDLHDQITNGTDCSVVRPKGRIELTYRGDGWSVQPGLYAEVTSLHRLNGTGERGRSDLNNGILIVTTSGLMIGF